MLLFDILLPIKLIKLTLDSTVKYRYQIISPALVCNLIPSNPRILIHSSGDTTKPSFYRKTSGATKKKPIGYFE